MVNCAVTFSGGLNALFYIIGVEVSFAFITWILFEFIRAFLLAYDYTKWKAFLSNTGTEKQFWTAYNHTKWKSFFGNGTRQQFWSHVWNAWLFFLTWKEGDSTFSCGVHSWTGYKKWHTQFQESE